MKIRLITLLISIFLPATIFAMDYESSVKTAEEAITAEPSSALTDATATEEEAVEAAAEAEAAIEAE